MIQQEQEGALDVEVSRPFHLEAICLLGGGHPTPLHQEVVRFTELDGSSSSSKTRFFKSDKNFLFYLLRLSRSFSPLGMSRKPPCSLLRFPQVSLRFLHGALLPYWD